jgi:hypothetical protein
MLTLPGSNRLPAAVFPPQGVRSVSPILFSRFEGPGAEFLGSTIKKRENEHWKAHSNWTQRLEALLRHSFVLRRSGNHLVRTKL